MLDITDPSKWYTYISQEGTYWRVDILCGEWAFGGPKFYRSHVKALRKGEKRLQHVRSLIRTTNKKAVIYK